MPLPGCLVQHWTHDQMWSLQSTPLNLMSSELLSLLVSCLREIKAWGRQLETLTRYRNPREESCQAKRIKEERRGSVRVSKCELMASDFLGIVPEIFGSAPVPASQIPSVFSVSLSFLEANWSWDPFTCRSDLILDPSQFWCTSPTQTEAAICISSIEMKSFILFWGQGLHSTKHSSRASLGVSALCVKVSLEWAWVIPEAAQHLHWGSQANPVVSLIKNCEICSQEDVPQDPGLWGAHVFCAPIKGYKADVFRNLGETKMHTSQYEHLPATPPQYPEQRAFPFFPLWEKSSGSHSSCRSEGIGTRRAKTCGCHERGVWGGEDWEFGIIRCKLIYRDCKTTKSYCIAQVTVFSIQW